MAGKDTAVSARRGDKSRTACLRLKEGAVKSNALKAVRKVDNACDGLACARSSPAVGEFVPNAWFCAQSPVREDCLKTTFAKPAVIPDPHQLTPGLSR